MASLAARSCDVNELISRYQEMIAHFPLASHPCSRRVLVVGGGQSGLEIAARLKLLGVSTLVCEKQARVGDQWRHRYAALCLHDVVCKCLSYLNEL